MSTSVPHNPWREQFPLIQGNELVYFDNAATTQKPRCVLDSYENYYTEENANIHRGTFALARLATEKYEAARATVADHIHAQHHEEVIFTSGTTDSINLVAHILTNEISAGDDIIISSLEHHSNIVPWQMLCERSGAKLRIIPCDENGILDLDEYKKILSNKTKIVACQWVSNAFGNVHPIAEIIAAAKAHGAYTVIDAAQAAPHFSIDVKAIDADFLSFSGHKVYAPTGIGILYGKKDLLEKLPPFKGGGEMIKEVTFAKTTYNVLPFKYEAGTPNIGGAIALGAALDFIQKIGMENIAAHETALIRAAEQALTGIDGIRFYGSFDRIGALSFNIDGIHHYDLGTLLDQMKIAVRTGHHCCQPLMARFGISGTVRASFALYNTLDEVSLFSQAVKKAVAMLR